MTSPNKVKSTICIIVEKGKEKYTKEKMQGAGIKMHIFSNDNINQSIDRIDIIKLTKPRGVFYTIGSAVFCENVKKHLEGFKGKSYRFEKASSEDDAMEKIGVKFPDEAQVHVKEEKKEDSEITTAIKSFSHEKFTEEEIAGVLFAMDELKTMKIFPASYEVIYDALIKTTKMYIVDESRAEALVDFYLGEFLKKNKENC